MSEVRKEPELGKPGGDSAQIPQHHGELSKEQLQDQLADLLFQTTEETFDKEALDALLDALDEVDPLPEELIPDTEESLERFHERYAPVFESVEAAAAQRAETPASSRRKHSKFGRIFPVAAIIVVLLCGMTAQAFHWNFFAAFARWTSETFRLDSSSASYAAVRNNPLAEGESASYDTPEEAVEAFGIDVPIVPKEIPERFTLTEVTASYRHGGILIYADYRSDDGSFQICYRNDTIVNTAALEKEYGNITTHLVGEITHYLVTDLGWEKAVWQNGDLECQLLGDVSQEELKAILDSIY